MLQLQHLTITHQKDLQTLIRDLNLVVNPGDKLALIGEEGTGKSTLLKAILNPRLIADYTIMEGTITNRFSRTGYLPQNIAPADLDRSLSNYLYHDIDYDHFDFNLFYQMAELFQFDTNRFDDHEQLVKNLSGGEKLKLQLLKILTSDPDLLLFDEPSSDLDLESLQWLEKFIKRTDKTVIFISHDEELLTNTATAILHLELLKKRQEACASYFHGDYQSYRQQRRERFERQLQLANKEREEHAKKSQKYQRIQQRIEHELRKTKNDVTGRLLAKKMHAHQAQKGRLNKEADQFTEIPQDMNTIDLFFSDIQALPAGKVILKWEAKELVSGQKVDWQIRGQDKLVITGQNGIGKTLLLKQVLEELRTRTDLSLGYMPQNDEEILDAHQTALSFLSDVATPEKVRTILASLQFTRQEVEHSVLELSGGQKAKLFLAKMVLEGNNVLILDEPTRHFSSTSQPLIRQLLKDYPGCIISVSHDRSFIKEIGDTIYQLDQKYLRKIQ